MMTGHVYLGLGPGLGELMRTIIEKGSHAKLLHRSSEDATMAP